MHPRDLWKTKDESSRGLQRNYELREDKDLFMRLDFLLRITLQAGDDLPPNKSFDSCIYSLNRICSFRVLNFINSDKILKKISDNFCQFFKRKVKTLVLNTFYRQKSVFICSYFILLSSKIVKQ